MNVFNVFRLENMPADVAEQNELVDKLFTVRNMHIHGETGYFLVRCTTIQPAGKVSVTKLDPSKEPDLMQELVEIFLENESKL